MAPPLTLPPLFHSTALTEKPDISDNNAYEVLRQMLRINPFVRPGPAEALQRLSLQSRKRERESFEILMDDRLRNPRIAAIFDKLQTETNTKNEAVLESHSQAQDARRRFQSWTRGAKTLTTDEAASLHGALLVEELDKKSSRMDQAQSSLFAGVQHSPVDDNAKGSSLSEKSEQPVKSLNFESLETAVLTDCSLIYVHEAK